MNAFQKIILICFILLNTLYGKGQYNGFPSRYYSPKNYKGFMQTWSCVQDQRGVLYFGNSTNILEYDGVNWRKIFVTNGVAIRTLHIDKNGKIYVGAVGDFGYLQADEKGEMKFKSLLPLISEKDKIFADIWEIHEINDKIIFQTSEKLYILHNQTITTVNPEKTTFASTSFKVSNKIYLRERKIGLKSFDGNKLELIPNGDIFSNEPLIGLVDYNNDCMITLSVDNGFFTINKKNYEIKKITPPSEKKLLEVGPLGLKKTNDSTFFVNTRGGAYFLNSKLEIIQSINKSDGLIDESISNMFIDSQDEMWLCTNNGISKFSTQSPFYFYNNSNGFTGNIESIIIFNNKIYLGTTSGIFSSPLNGNNSTGRAHQLKFEQIEGTYFETWNFFEHDNQLYIASSDGVLSIPNNKITRLTKAYSNSISKSNLFPNRMYVAEKDGIRILEKNNGNWNLLTYLNFQANDIMGVLEFGKTRDNKIILWATTRNSGILKISLDSNFKTEMQIYSKEKRGAPTGTTDIATYKNKLYFHTVLSIYEYIPELDDGKSVCIKEVKGFPITFNHIGEELKLLNTATEEGKKTITALLSIEDQGYTYYQNSKDILWIGLTDVLVRYDSKNTKNYSNKYNTLIRKVVIGTDSTLFFGTFNDENKNVSINQPEYFKKQLPYSLNTISFDFAAPFFEREDKTMFKYQLIGFDTAWSDWTNSSFKQYTNLYEGDYTFSVKAKNIYENESTIATFKFTILPPWYRTIWAYLLYLLVLFILIIVVVRISVRQLRIAKIKLEKTVKERTAQVVKQKEELEQKNELIEIAYNDIKSSINYAKRIQEAILPLKEEIKKYFPESFILYKPRDIVSGDFYWFNKHNGKYIIACVDCTGHGVPGAFMSMIGNTLLNEIIIEKNIVKPSEILNLLHERVRQSLKQDNNKTETRDGMDIAICVIDENKKTLQYAGANRTLLLIQNNQLSEIKPDKKPIGGDRMNEESLFTNHTIELQKDDIIYLSTDGYADQFGGEKGKKFMVKRFIQLILEIKNETMDKQSNTLLNTITAWQGNLEQVDDILVIGIKI